MDSDNSSRNNRAAYPDTVCGRGYIFYMAVRGLRKKNRRMATNVV